MSFKKLSPAVNDALSKLEITEPLPFQQKVLGPLRGGADHYVIAPENEGKTLALILTVMKHLEVASVGDNPRALIFVKDKAAAEELEQRFLPFTRHTDLRVFLAIDQHDIQGQRDNIYLGVDLLIGTPKRLRQLHHQNGFNMAELTLFGVEDGDKLDANELQDIIVISDSLGKCQRIVTANDWLKRFEKLNETMMSRSKKIRSNS